MVSVPRPGGIHEDQIIFGDDQGYINILTVAAKVMHSSKKNQDPPNAVDFLWSCDKVYHKQEVCFLLYFLGQIVTWKDNLDLLD